MYRFFLSQKYTLEVVLSPSSVVAEHRTSHPLPLSSVSILCAIVKMCLRGEREYAIFISRSD